MRRFIVSVAWLGASLINGAAAAESVFKCSDQDGNLTFTDRPCKQSGVEVEITESAATYSDPSKEINAALDLVQSSRERHDNLRAEAQQEAAVERQRDSSCDQLAAYKKKLEGGGFFYRPDDPERKALSDEEIAADIAELEREYAANCRS